MAAPNRGLLAEIEDDLLAGKPLADPLRKTIIFGRSRRISRPREWVSRELKGFVGTSASGPSHGVEQVLGK